MTVNLNRDSWVSLFLTEMTGAASALFLLDIKGRVLIWRDYRGDVSAAQAEHFFTKLIEKEVCSLLASWVRNRKFSFQTDWFIFLKFTSASFTFLLKTKRLV